MSILSFLDSLSDDTKAILLCLIVLSFPFTMFIIAKVTEIRLAPIDRWLTDHWDRWDTLRRRRKKAKAARRADG